MPHLGLETRVVESAALENSVARFREAGVVLPTLAQLAQPSALPPEVERVLAGIPKDAPHPLNLFRVHWYNAMDGTRTGIPEYLELPRALTGVPVRILVVLGNRFPLIAAHKVLAAYGCLVPRLVTGQFDPTRHRAVWPSTGNYCRGGVAISRILRCRGVAVLPEGMSRERFAWLEKWVEDPSDIVRTPGTESNVKEIYDRCKELDRDPANIVFNQFSEFGNYLVHYLCTGAALSRVYESAGGWSRDERLAAFVAASGSAGTLGAGDYLKERHGAAIAVVEAVECPTLLYNGFGEHNIQGIGDKHVPLIHNVMNTDVAIGISDRSTDALNVLFNTPVGRGYLTGRKGVSPDLVKELGALGVSGLCNVLAAIKLAAYMDLGERDVIMTVATDGADMYVTERDKTLAREFGTGFDETAAAEVFGRELGRPRTDHLLELTRRDRERIFNLGYYTWVEQQGTSIEDFTARRRPEFWRGLRELAPAWDALIEEMNRRVGGART